ncbi:hypothetical protein JXA12_05825 [Candidatus Woesearchaeota archaeon]|nr:hypothetical protein [Candidatus Woesearchaeota archaeon]
MKKAHRILILGAPGTGKNWLSERVSTALSIPFFDTDDIAWKRKYAQKRTHEEICALVEKNVVKDSWVIGSGARSYLESAVMRSTHIIILQEPFARTVFRIFRRYLNRKVKREYDTLKGVLWLVKDSRQRYYKSSGKIYQFYEQLKKDFPEKTMVLSKKGTKEYLSKLS